MNAGKNLAYLDRCRHIIAKHGHMVQVVGADPYGFAYTVGLTPLIGCELFTVGLPEQTAQVLLNAVAAKLQQASIADGESIPDAANLPLKLLTLPVVDSAQQIDRGELIAVAGALGYKPRNIRQLLWPDRAGRFPGEAQYDHPVAQSVDLLLSPPPAAQLH